MDATILPFNITKNNPRIIKVIGVGGGGGNAVTHMYHEGIRDVSFLLCNTDKQALDRSEVPDQLVLGENITHGLGAGNEPEIAKKAAEASKEDIMKLLGDGTRMVFITAGMGGGTGTGAAPIIARFAKEMGILTVGIVTIPFVFEGQPKILQALHGVEAINKNVDALLVINNERLREIYADLSVTNAFAKADDTLAVAAKSIAEIITVPGIINLDFADVNTTMRNGGVALMSIGYGEGEGRVRQAIEDALNSPLLNNNDVFSAKKILFNVSFSEKADLLMEEMTDVHNFMARFNPDIKVIWGTAKDDSLENKVKMTILATGFGTDILPYNETLEADKREQTAKDEDELNRKRQEEEERNNELIEKWYGKEHIGKKVQFVILTPDELDDDKLISILEENPTYERDPQLITQARSRKASEAKKIREESVQADNSGQTGNKTVISFD